LDSGAINDHTANTSKLELIQTFLKLPKTQVIVSSTIQPSRIFDFYERKIKEATDKSDQELYKKSLRSWKNAIGGFMNVYQPLAGSPELTRKIENNSGYVELSRGNFLPGLWNYFRGTPLTNHTELEDFILRVEELSDNYYHSIWSSLSHQEKMQLYDLAKDQFVNLKNLQVVRLLIQKGIVIVEDSLRTMNRSFNNFILSVVREDEEIAMDQELRSKGTWNTVQIVLLLAVVGIITFISLAQQDILHDLNTLITTLGAVLALLLRFGGLFSGTPKVKE